MSLQPQSTPSVVDHDAFLQYCSEHRLSPRAGALLEHLIEESATWPTGFVDHFEAGTCAAEFGLGTRAGRRTLVRWLQELIDAGAVDYTPRLGRTPGCVRVLVFDLLTLGRDLERDKSPGARFGARSGRLGRDLERDLERDRVAPQGPYKELTTTAVTAVQEVSERDRAPRTAAKDWTDDELDELVGPLARLCASASPPLLGMDDRAGVLAALGVYDRAQVTQAVGKVCAKALATKVPSPFGLLVSLARRAAPEYFTVPADRVGDDGLSAPRPTSSFGRPLIDKSDLAERYGE